MEIQIIPTRTRKLMAFFYLLSILGTTPVALELYQQHKLADAESINQNSSNQELSYSQVKSNGFFSIK